LSLNSTPRRRFGVALGVVLTGVAAGLIGFAGIASAHTPHLSAECKGETTTLTVKLDSYNARETNTVKVTDGGTTLDEGDFKSSYDKKFDVPGNVDHSFTVKVVAGDDKSGKKGWSFEKTLDVKACVAPPETTTTTTEAPPETTTTTEAPPSSETTTTTTEVAPVVNTPTTSPAPEVQNEGLAETGASIAWPLGIAGVLLVGGVVALFVVRRRGSTKA
jgi:LPXTG-motif cell wall-anchored protein